MRAGKTLDGYRLRGYAGTTGVLLAMDIPLNLRNNLLGFSIERKKGNGDWKWLQGLLRFPHQGIDLTKPINSNLAPIQKFRWSDYCVYPNTTYQYRIHGAYDDPENLNLVDGPTITLKTESLGQGKHQIIFNRAAAASQAFARKFPDVNINDENIDDAVRSRALNWLSRGLDQKILSFIDRAIDDKWAVDMAIYEIEHKDIVDHLLAALNRGAKIRIVYHAKKKDKQTDINRKFLKDFPDNVTKVGRVTSSIFHHKFLILRKLEGSEEGNPLAVLTGSTNHTLNGLYLQSNVVHVVENPAIASRYYNLFKLLFQGCTVGETKNFITSNNILLEDNEQVLFSPRSDYADLKKVRSIICKAKENVIFCTTFKMDPLVISSFLPCEPGTVIRYGLQNSRSSVTGIHRFGTFVAPAYLKQGLEGFLKESTAGQKGNILVHLKAIVCDFTTDSPTVITGSNNFSTSASSKNDENMLVINGDTGVADTYACEIMRLYDHYRFRYNIKERSEGNPGGFYLEVDDKWTNPYFIRSSLKERERKTFCSNIQTQD